MATGKNPDYAKELTSPHEPVYEVAMMLVNSIPVAGPAVALLAGRVFPDPGQASRDRFVIKLAERVDALYDRDNILDALGRPESAALLSHALNIASRSFGQEKLEALRNATVNGVFHAPQNVNLTALVFGILDRLTDGHISMLKYIAKQEEELKQSFSWERVKMIGVDFKKSPDGMKSPQRVLSFDEEECYMDTFEIRTNEILLADLISLGLIEQRFAPVPPSILDWSTDASKNLPAYACVTDKGHLTLEHIAETKNTAG